ncbi:hypothetical protein [Actinospongicola halichondriae]|uniref:hypothetical protein n=1 Tax=Actinospongicola halichondriae TaxID=3236844 RepID=UPI003D5722F5
MVDPDETFDPAEVTAAERLDAQIDAMLGGHAHTDTDPEVLLLASAVRTDPPRALAARVEGAHERSMRRRWRPFRYAAGAMAYLFISQGFGNLVWGDWVAEGVGDDFSPHLTREGGYALIAVGLAVATGALVRRMAPVAVISGVPLATALGISGVGEIGVFTAGAVLHITQGLVGLALGVTFWRYWRPDPTRDTSDSDDEEGS